MLLPKLKQLLTKIPNNFFMTFSLSIFVIILQELIKKVVMKLIINFVDHDPIVMESRYEQESFCWNIFQIG